MLSGRVIEIMVQRSNQVNFITDTLRVFIRRLANTTQPYFYIYLVHGLQVMDRWRTLEQYGITELSERPYVNIVVSAAEALIQQGPPLREKRQRPGAMCTRRR